MLVPLPFENPLFEPQVELDPSVVVFVESSIQLLSRDSVTETSIEITSVNPIESSELVPIVNEPPSEFDSDCDESMDLSRVFPH